jgi:hypothetical protein
LIGDLEAALLDTNLISRNQRIANVMRGLNAENIKHALELMKGKSMRDGTTREAWRMLLYSWAKFDPQNALGYAAANSDGRSQWFAVETIMNSWGEDNFNSAARWVVNDADPKIQSMALNALVLGYSNKNPAEAAKFVAGLAPDLGHPMFRQVAERFAESDPVGAAAWVDLLPPGSARGQAIERVADRWARRDPKAAGDWVARHAGEKEANDAGRRVAIRMAEADPNQAMQWTASLPDGDVRNTAQRAAMSKWAQQNAEGAADWINRLPSDYNADPLVEVYARQVARNSPEDALAAAESIADPKRRQEWTLRLAQYWSQRDSKAAAAWLANSSLSESQRLAITMAPRNIPPPWHGLD